MAGRDEEARAQVKEILRLSPNFSLEIIETRAPWKDPADGKAIISRPNFLTSGYGGSSNSLYTAIEVLQSPLHELGEARQGKAFSIQPAPPPARHLGEDPPQMHPHVEQDEGQGEQHEAIGGILRRRPAPHLTRTAIAGLKAKAPAIELAGRAGREVQVEQNEQQPR